MQVFRAELANTMNKKTITLSLLSVGIISLLAFNFNIKPKADRPPNVVLVYIDDLGFGDLGRTGAVDYTTPNFDDMASKGMFLSHYYAPQAVCTASRAGLLTGCYPNRIGFAGATDHSAKTGIDADEETIAELLKAKGYATAAFGKWYLGFQKQFLPLQHGFAEYFGIPYSNDMWPNHPVNKNYYPPLPLIEGNETVATNPDQSQFTTIFTERTISFIKKNMDKPFIAEWPGVIPAGVVSNNLSAGIDVLPTIVEAPARNYQRSASTG